MELRSIKGVNVKNKRVILRVHLDVHYQEENGELVVEDDTRLRAMIPAINNMLERGAGKVILISWLQRPGGKVVEEMRMTPVGKRLSELLSRPVIKLDDCIGQEVRKAIDKAPRGSIILLENVRFHSGEKGTHTFDEEYSKELAKNGDIFVNNAFGQTHRNVASIVGITEYLPSYAGPELEKEVRELWGTLENPDRPFVGIIGGAKISTKLGVIRSLLDKVDDLLLGGALANTILLAKGLQVGTSLIEESMLETAKQLPLTDTRLHIPIDVIVAREISEDAETHIRAVGNVKEDEKILDIGPDTLKLYEKVIQQAKTIMWNGPMGYFEIEQFAKGTDETAELLSASEAKTLIGGGETVASVKRLGLQDKMSFISMGGGAMLDLLEKGTLPGLKPLIK